jgi:type II secretory ATPase GspE/PulE/Tfp pilus assembly ATPase PilB-like protein
VPLAEETEHRLTPHEKTLMGGKETRGAGCEKCKGAGFRGRLGFFEIVRISSQLRAAISSNRAVMELRKFLETDFLSMRDDGMLKAAEGITTPDEVLRATQDVEDAVV